MSETVARTGWPCSPKTSHSVVGQAIGSGASMLRSFKEAAILALVEPSWLIPERSPLTSAMKTGTPILENCSAICCSVTVFPVPVAPVIKPWRLAKAGRMTDSVAEFLAINWEWAI